MTQSTCRPARLLAVALLLGASPVWAEQYESELEIDTQLDLYDLQERGDISDETLESLLELYRTGVDLNSASREELYELPNLTYAEVDAILRYRELQGRINDPADLVAAGAITARQLSQIAPFLVLYQPEGSDVPVTGRARLIGAYAAADSLAPPLLLQLRLRGPANLTGGLALVGTRRELGDVFWDGSRSVPGLSVEPPSYGPRLPKFFLQWKTPQRAVIAGTYRIGFGQRLTLDNTRRYTPNGFYIDDTILVPSQTSTLCRELDGEAEGTTCSEDDETALVTEDFGWSEGFRGVAGSLEQLELGGATKLSLHGFGSYQSRSIYQYQVYNRDTCEDPRFDDDSDQPGSVQEGCAAPTVYKRVDNLSAEANSYQFVTLPDVYDEVTGGGHARLELSPALKLGVTGYYSAVKWKVDGASLDFQEWARYPFGGPFGAVGMDGALNLGFVNLYLEGTRSFDSLPDGGGGFGVLQRTTVGPKKSELEVSLRYYAKDFVNPYARAISQPDQFEGQRARNEVGVRTRYLGKPNEDWRFRGTLDLWRWPSDGELANTAGRTGLELSGRVDFLGWHRLQLSGWGSLRNQAIDLPSRAACLDVAFDDESEIEGLLTAGGGNLQAPECIDERTSLALRVTGQPLPDRNLLSVWVQGQQTWLGDASPGARGHFLDASRQDWALWLGAQSRPVDPLRLRARLRYRDEAANWESRVQERENVGPEEVTPYSNAEDTFLATLDATWRRPRQTVAFGLRYDFLAYFNEPIPSGATEPVRQQEHRFRGEFEVRF